ncbi:ATPase [uncultured Jannaschia sp.]|uniref:ATPase n=1 Tax=uncultured Jannaschia sp. TaxID=293347 RepID=UPI0026048EB2|nr:ATPase [uncultured Jannaschia sp.]
MIYRTPQDWLSAPDQRVTFFGMSGLGKTHLARLLRDAGGWFHYSVDYRIGTAYLGEHIADNLKRHAMQVPLLADLLRSDSIYIASNITFGNLAPLSTYLGKPGDPAKGGLAVEEYRRRQALHRQAEIDALLDTPAFIERAREIYGYDRFVCDTGGSICEVVDPSDPRDEVLTALAGSTLLCWIEGDETHAETLKARFDRAPKPMYYRPGILDALWAEHGGATTDPDAFARLGYAALIDARQPRYAAMAANWGVTVRARDAATARDAADVTALVADAIGKAARRA